MLTTRGYRWLILITAWTVVATLLGSDASLFPLWTALALLVLFVGQWLYFALLIEGLRGQLQVERRLWQGSRPVETLWARLPFTVELTVTNRSRWFPAFLLVEDVFAPGTVVCGGCNRWGIRLDAGQSVVLRYERRAPALGSVRCEGVQVIVADGPGFFQHRWMLREARHWWVLPLLTDEEGRQRALKPFNLLPPPGMHRWRRPGTGSELLDLRDYQPGDPPKMVAWKVSARREQLITKEFESDVPVRCLLFVDGSESMRLGEAGERGVERLAEAAAILGQAAASHRDLVGLVCFDARGVEVLPPARTRQHLLRFLQSLAQMAARPARSQNQALADLTRQVWLRAQYLYPELLQPPGNGMPLSRLWWPLLDRRWGWLIPLIMVANLLLLILVPAWRSTCLELAAAFTRWSFPGAHWTTHLVVFLISAVVLSLGPFVFASSFWVLYGSRDLLGSGRRRLTRRKQLAALLAFQQGTGPASIERLMHDDEVFLAALRRFLQEHQVPVIVPWYDLPQQQQYQEPEKIFVLAQALLRAVGQARDNELYVILADLARDSGTLTPLITACRVARARHHHVLVIVPGPQTPSFSMRDASGRRSSSPVTKPAGSWSTEAIQQRLARRDYERAFQQMRRQLVAVGAAVLRLDADDPLPVVLERLDRLRGYRSRR
ncbi:MAG: hypothetical protein KatS3mg106_779 [Gemmataceae bacterium]|jgi:uncharacterized protein (DUF58 family)|nr:MAG: hypothetical protein KatS3mg106_779 [Gemmataceae bacterium]